MLGIARSILQRGPKVPLEERFVFDRPLVLFQGDDWGRVGVRDREGFEQLRSGGIALGEKPYDFYTLETAEDVFALSELLMRHRDSIGRPACLEMNFILANVDFQQSAADAFDKIHLRPLADGLPGNWERPKLLEAYAQGIADGLFFASLHGVTHFCRPAVEACLAEDSERSTLLRKLWKAETPYIHWRMPWIGYEYWNPDCQPAQRFVTAEMQQRLIRGAAEIFKRLFSTPAISACAPGYRANNDTHSAWAQNGIRVSQNGTRGFSPPRLDHHGLLQVSRTIDFEPATDSSFSVQKFLRLAEGCFSRGIPAVISVHAINFHSSLKDFRSTTLQNLDQFLFALEAKYPKLLYIHDADLLQVVQTGKYECAQGSITVPAKKQNFSMAQFETRSRA